jgi:hypothetical protein
MGLLPTIALAVLWVVLELFATKKLLARSKNELSRAIDTLH